jgi:hypothetical protein
LTRSFSVVTEGTWEREGSRTDVTVGLDGSTQNL